MTRSAHMNITASGRRIAQRLLAVQGIAAVILIVLFGLLMGLAGAFSAAAGALSALIPNSIFAALVFRHGGARAAQDVVNSFLAGEALKIVLSMVLLVVALSFLDGPLLPLFTVFALLHLMHILAPILLLKTN